MVMLSKPTLPCDEVFLDAVLGAVLAVHGQAVRHRDPAAPPVVPTGVAPHEPESKIRTEIDLRVMTNFPDSPPFLNSKDPFLIRLYWLSNC